MSELALQLIEKEKRERTGKLDLGNCGLTDFPIELFELTWLKELSFSSGFLDEGKRIWVKSINDRSPNNIRVDEIPTDFINLHNLTFLRLDNWRVNWNLRNCSILGYLKKLEYLSLSYNQIKDVSFLENLTKLKYLDISSNQISDIRYLENLTNLQSLDLRKNRVTSSHSLHKLIELQTLNLRYNQISDISFLGNMTRLTTLDLSNNQISDISFLENMTFLQSLHLSSNQIDDISSLKSLTKLQSLDLSSNQIKDIGILEYMTNIKYLDLRYNQIFSIRSLLPLIKKGLSIINKKIVGDIFISKNPVAIPPISIINKGNEAVINWFEQIDQQGSENLYEARVVIVGESEAGKTTLFRKLQDENIRVPDPEQKSTHGININYQREFKHYLVNDVIIKAAIWDFGGQDIQTYLHQYFFSNDNLFVLVCDQRAEKTRFDYWFEVITRLCEESRIVVVRNKKERETASQPLNIVEYENRFPGLKLSCVDVDLKNNDAHWKSLIQTIEENLSEFKRVNEIVPKKWKPIREKIQDLKDQKKQYISIGEFQSICNSAGLKEERFQEQCLDYLHWLGFALHYEDSGLNNNVFIDPQWITIGLYEILKEYNYKENSKGRFSKNDIHNIWKEKDYTIEDRNHLLNLLLKDRFEVCYHVENTDNYLVPLLISNEKKQPEKPEEKAYILRFKFPFMPFGFFSRLIVRLYEKIWDDYVWLTGVWLLDRPDCSALLEHFKDTHTGDEVFELSIYGSKQKRKELLSVIRNEIYHIKNLLFKNLIIHEQIPCPCKFCENALRPYFHYRNELEQMIERKQFYSQCKNSGDLISIGQLLDSIIDMDEFKKQIKEMEKEGINIHLENIGNPQIHLEAKAIAKAEATATNTVTISIQNIIGEVQNLKEDVARELKIKKVPQEEIELITSDIEVAESALKELEAAQKQSLEFPAKSKGRLKQFIDDLSDESSTLHKGLKLLRKGKDYGVTLAETYNKVAENIGLPLVPPLALDVIKNL